MCNCHDYDDQPLAIGKPAPDFSAPAYFKGDTDHHVSLEDYKGKWVILFFYPLDFTFVCPTELYELAARQEDFEKEGIQIIGASVDSVYSHKGWADADKRIAKIEFPILSDLTKEISWDYRVLHDDGMSFRGAFIIDPDGILRSMTVNDLPVGRNIDELLRTTKAFKTGELCPVNWDEGKDTLGKA